MADRPERARTDRSLNTARERTDREIALRRAAALEDADEVLAGAD